MGSDRGELTFRVPPTGQVLGRAAIDFIADHVAKEHHRDASTLRFAVSYVDDVYGNSVAAGAESEMAARGLHDVGNFGYDFRTVDMAKLVRKIASVKPDVLFVSAYLDDAIALRRQLVAQHVELLANIGTSSSYCMPAFGQTLGKAAVGVYASDKPSADLDRSLRPHARGSRPPGPREHGLPRPLPRGHEPRGAGRVLRGLGAVPRRDAEGSVDGAHRGRGRGSGHRPPQGQPPERERAEVRRAGHSRRR